jgi:hypothetical protein
MFHMTNPTLDPATSTLPPVPPARRTGGGYRLLVERQLGQDVRDWVNTRRAAGRSEKAIAEEMSKALDFPADVEISRRLLRNWCGPAKGGPAERDDGEEAD